MTNIQERKHQILKRYGNLYGKICSVENLENAHRNARKDKLFYKEVKMVDSDLHHYIMEIHEMLVNHTYKINPERYTVTTINDKGKERELAKLPYFPDRIIQWAIMLQLEPIFMEVFCSHTCASIKGRGITHAKKLLNKYLKDWNGTKYCLKMDVKKFYPSIDHEILKGLLRRKFKDEELLDLLDMIIDSSPHEKGVPIGSYLSQFLANYYLAYFDHWLKEDLGVKYVVRYMDDVVILSDSKEELHHIREQIDEYLQTNLNLELKSNWQVFPVESRGVDFVGFRTFHRYCLLRKKTCLKFKKKMLKLKKKHDKGQLFNYSEWCSGNSYKGWLNMCSGRKLFEKYIVPIQESLDRYYKEVIQIQKGQVKTA